MNTPVAIFIFNRPDCLRVLLRALREVRPTHVLVVSDGPRNTADVPLCNECRNLIETIDWPCRIDINYSTSNLGCRVRLATGITWTLEQVEECIILEDDCIPHPSFFRFASRMLDVYRSNEEIMMISGDQPLGVWPSAYSYQVSKHALIWGWATWRRAWKYYDVDMREWPSYRESSNFRTLHDDPCERAVWESCLQRAFNGHSTWDYQWSFAMWLNHGYAIIPKVNLVRNIGFGPDATHTKSVYQAERCSLKAVELSFPYLSPPLIAQNKEMDRAIFKLIFAND